MTSTTPPPPPFHESKKVVVAGSASSGKSSLVQRAVTNTFTSDYLQTFGADLCVKNSSEKTKYALNIWTCGGHERYRALLEQFFVGADVVILCFDMLSTSSFQELPYWFNEYKRNAPDALAIMVGTKSDDADSIKIKPQDALKQAKEWGIEFRAVSSKTGMNIGELFDHVVASL
ncbi:small GTP-binding protein domain [Spizellomyces punctatus DAOM BR117]|uniref:Small GTP-binding protein domain n=1 Tax=Spizellomyces punctatus (strain DAOM BR117) TaxID=645134 RepID=A0A0L0HKY6_SPIPD|nr:small GTP-binding protein domain [Spizellomyces punctatus DAOM BR117]KND01782.1 small GTP-binding protein domain [Spizellomyces punctatus DAOM BR117]|eukprot:XP_016609821.1 small GTP-binding protein domain [Spizellomyces punctatus DAOM BR117]